MAPWAAPRKAACESAPRRPRTHAGICNDASRPRVPRSSAPPSAARTVTSSWNLAHQCRNGPLRPRRRGLRRTERAYGGRLVFARENARDGVFARENARDGFGHALESASSAEPARSLSGNRPKPVQGDVFRDAFKERGKGSALQLKGAKRDSRLGAGVAANVRRPFSRILSSRALESAATRPVALSYPSVMRGLAQPGRPATAVLDDFPLRPPKNKAKKSFS
jgi:hypothetical protein